MLWAIAAAIPAPGIGQEKTTALKDQSGPIKTGGSYAVLIICQAGILGGVIYSFAKKQRSLSRAFLMFSMEFA
jgi:hypothetical protein